MDERAVAALSGGLSRALNRLYALKKGTEQQELETAATRAKEQAEQEDRNLRSHQWTMDYLLKRDQHEQNIQEKRDAETREAEREMRKAAISEESRKRLIDANEDRRFDAYIRGEYVPASEREENRFKARYAGDMAEFAAKGSNDKKAGREQKEQDYIGESLKLTSDLTESRRKIAAENAAHPYEEPMVDPFLNVSSPVQAYNLAIRPRVMADTSFSDPIRAADSIAAQLSGQPWPPKKQPNGPMSLEGSPESPSAASVVDSSGRRAPLTPSTRAGVEYVPRPTAPAAQPTPALNQYSPEELAELQQLLLEYHSTPAQRGKAMTAERLQRLYQLVYKGEMNAGTQ